MKHPILLAQFSAATPWDTWVSFGAGLWYVNFDAIYPDVDDAFLVDIATRQFEHNVGAVLYEGEDLGKAESLTELLSTPSYYWDSSSRTLYAHFPLFNPPNSTVSVGILYSVAQELFDGQEGTIFLPHLKDVPPLQQEKDRLFFKKLSVGSWSMTLDNAGLTYDGIPDWGVYNRVVQYYLGEAGEAFSTFVPIRTGRIRDFAFRGSDVVVNVQDLRAQLTLRVPTSSFTVAQYADLDPKMSGKKKPLAFGRLFGVEPVCLNSMDAAGPYVFMLADGAYGAIKSVDEVSVDGVVVTPSAIDLEAGTFTLTAGQVLDGKQFKTVLVDFQGYVDSLDSVIENPLDIITWLLLNFAAIPYTDAFYDQLEWGRERDSKPAVATYLDKPTQILSVIESMMEATRGGFLVTSDGRYTWRTPNYESRPKWNITDLDWIEVPDVPYDTSEVLASVRVGYRKDQAAGTFRYIEDESKLSDVYRDYRILDDEDFELVLTDEADAEAFAADVMQLSSVPAAVVTGRVPMKFADMQIGQNAQVAVNRYINGEFVAWLGTLRGEILSVAPDAVKGEVEISIRVVDGVPEYLETSGTGAVYGASVYGASSYGEG